RKGRKRKINSRHSVFLCAFAPLREMICESGSSMTRTVLQATLRGRLDAVRERLRAACERSGRAGADVTLVAVTKTVDVAVAEALPALGVLDLGENRPQELWRKVAALPPTVRCDPLGHLA